MLYILLYSSVRIGWHEGFLKYNISTQSYGSHHPNGFGNDNLLRIEMTYIAEVRIFFWSK